MIDPITRWFEAMQSNNKEVMRIVNLVQIIWPIRYPWPQKPFVNQDRKSLLMSLKIP